MQSYFNINAINLKRSRLVKRKQQLERDYREAIADIDAELESIDKALAVINDAAAPYVCKVCGGTGETRRCDAAGQMEDVTCSACHGTGININCT